MRIGVAHHDPGQRDALVQAIAQKPEHRVIWTATSGHKAVELCARDTPDLVLIDLLIDGMDGVEATRLIMTTTPCAVLVVTESVHGHAARVFEAMGHGALDAAEFPARAADNPRDSAAPLLAKLCTVARLIGEHHPPHRAGETGRGPSRSRRAPLVAIGASAGGPAALAVVLARLPKDFPAAIVVVQHVDERFAPGMATWLNQHSSLPVVVAQERQRLVAGSVLLAGTEDHLQLREADRLGYTPEPRNHAYRPSIDVFFQSVSRLWRGEAAGVLLTGMGRDGAQGLKTLRSRGHHTIAQDEASSAVYGMPKAAAALNAAVDILPMEQIAPRLIDWVTSRT